MMLAANMFVGPEIDWFKISPLLVMLGDGIDITNICTENLTSDPQTIICDFTDWGLPADGLHG